MAACADVRARKGEETWLTGEMQGAYRKLHELGYAHSIEAWWDGELAGGLYGVALGQFFFGESMFHVRPNASKVLLVRLVRFLADRRFALLDCQVPNAHLISMGATLIPRQEFLGMLTKGGLGPDGLAPKVVLPGKL
jgi:leucyl/phenylalanyl-tRNA--protein transferase